MLPPKGTPTSSEDVDFVCTKSEQEKLDKPAAELTDDERRNMHTPVPQEFELLDKYWKASNFLSAAQIYLNAQNPLLRRPLELGDIKPRLLGHWGTCPGQNFIYTHLNRIITDRKLQMLYISGPGHGGNFLIAQTYLEGTYSDYYPRISQDEIGLGKLFQQFSSPGGVNSHCSPEAPGSMHEGGELGYSLSHAFGAVLDKPDLMVACVIGDGEAETGPLATSWHGNKFLNPHTDGVVLPILHLNGFKIANASFLDRIPQDELMSLLRGYGYDPLLVQGSDPGLMHPAFASALDTWVDKVARIKQNAKAKHDAGELLDRPIWPMIILKSPKGWQGPTTVDGKVIEGSFRSHQVPISSPNENKSHLKLLEEWLKSYELEKLFDKEGKLFEDLQALRPPKELQMGRNPYTNPVRKPLALPENLNKFAVPICYNSKRGIVEASDNKALGKYLAEVFALNENTKNFRMFSPDETDSNRLTDVWESTNRQFMGIPSDIDEKTAQYGRVIETLSEHQCEGLLEGYLLTGGHGLLNSYEAFIHVIDSMFNQHAKWLNTIKNISWRNNLNSLNILLSSHVWRQDHNGFTHQDPGFLNHMSTKKGNIMRIYLPPDGNCLLSVMHHCLGTYNRCNVIVSSKHEAPQWLTLDEAKIHVHNGCSIWGWASNEKNQEGQFQEPHVIVACAGDVPTLEALAATSILRKKLPGLRVRFINIVDLFVLSPPSSDGHPHGLSHQVFDSMFTNDKPVVFAFHGYPHLVEKLVYKRHNRNFFVKGYMEEGTITTPFDMTVRNHLDRYHLVMEVCNQIEQSNCICDMDQNIRCTAAHVRQEMLEKLAKHRDYINTEGVDMEEVLNWKWEPGMEDRVPSFFQHL